MKASIRLLENACRITLFTKANCSLCDTAKNVLQKVQARKQFDFEQINIMAHGQEKWHNDYVFDVPVIHVEPTKELARGTIVAASQKLMHRFSEAEVEDLLNRTENH